MSSIQSVPGQPDAAPDSMPRHQTDLLEPWFAFAWLSRSAQVFGGLAP